MARGVSLDIVRQKLKSECGESVFPNPEVDNELSQLICNKQEWLSTEFDWPFLHEKWDATCSSIFTDLPTVTVDGDAYSIDIDRALTVEHKDGNIWHPLEYGISDEEYNLYDSRNAATADPIQRWMLHGATKFEVWPVPTTVPQYVRFSGYRRLSSLKQDGDESVPMGWDDSRRLDLDDLLVVLYCAAERLARRSQRDAAAKMQLAMERMRVLRAMSPSRPRHVVYGGAADEESQPVKLVAIK